MIAPIQPPPRVDVLTPMLRRRGVGQRVIDAVARTPRELFVPAQLRDFAYDDEPLPIGYGQTISQPSLVAEMTDLLAVTPTDVVLEVGTGSGWQGAILARLAKHVYTIDIVEPLVLTAREAFASLSITNITAAVGDGYLGWPEHAPFAAICVTASADRVPQPLVDQLSPGGRMVIPVEDALLLVTKDERGRTRERHLMRVAFVPLLHPARCEP